MPKLIDLTGREFGRLKVISRGNGPQGRPHWECVCVCGCVTVVSSGHLLSGHTSSCGCLSKEISAKGASNRFSTHRLSRTKEWNSWQAMKRRCNDPKNKDYHNYGGRGITYCQSWESFESFVEDMGSRPLGMTLDRIDPHGNYEPANCRWASAWTQSRNRRVVTRCSSGR